MKPRVYIRFGILLILFSIFVSFIIMAGIRLLALNSNASYTFTIENIPLPSLTFCPEAYVANDPAIKFNEDNLDPWTLEDFYRESKPYHDRIISGTFQTGTEYNMTTRGRIAFGGVEMEESINVINLGQFSPGGSGLVLTKCITFNPPRGTEENLHRIFSMQINQSGIVLGSVVRHEQDQLDPLETKWGSLTMLESGYSYGMMLQVSLGIRLNNRKYQCDEDNSQKKTACINEYMEKELNCSLPWLRSKSGNGIKLCDQHWQMKKFFEIVKNSIPDGICSMPNCGTYDWNIEMSYTMNDKLGMKDDIVNVEVVIAKGSKAEIVDEVLSYGIESFISDFGGYLGLLLGGSMLSIYDFLLDSFDRFQNRKSQNHVSPLPI